MFRRRKPLNDIFEEFDSMFNQFDSIFNGSSKDYKVESGTDEIGDWKKETYLSPSGSIFITNFVRTSNNTNNNSSVNQLKSKLQKAIDDENFEEAVKIRDEIKNHEKNQDSIKKLELELKKSIEEQNFEKSIELRDQLKKLKS
jgi:excinuclease UvrABC helicase subunit UvrB